MNFGNSQFSRLRTMILPDKNILNPSIALGERVNLGLLQMRSWFRWLHMAFSNKSTLFLWTWCFYPSPFHVSYLVYLDYSKTQSEFSCDPTTCTPHSVYLPYCELRLDKHPLLRYHKQHVNFVMRWLMTAWLLCINRGVRANNGLGLSPLTNCLARAGLNKGPDR